MSVLRWGILSTANIAVEKVIPGMRTSSRSEVLAIASRDRERAEATARQLGVPRAYGSYEELLADPDIDAVYVPLPNHLHPAWTIAAARAGKHVLCEKPLAMSAAEAQSAAPARAVPRGLAERGRARLGPAQDLRQLSQRGPAPPHPRSRAASARRAPTG